MFKEETKELKISNVYKKQEIENKIIDILNNPFNHLSPVIDWITFSRKDKQRIILHYIDSVDIERHGNSFKIINIIFYHKIATNNEVVIRTILIKNNKLRIGIITLDVAEIYKYTKKVYDFIIIYELCK